MVGPPTRPDRSHQLRLSMCCSGVPVIGLAALQRALGAAMPRSTQSPIRGDWATRKRANGGCAHALKPAEPCSREKG